MGLTSAIDFAPPRPVDPPGQRGSWRWVWVPEEPSDVRDWQTSSTRAERDNRAGAADLGDRSHGGSRAWREETSHAEARARRDSDSHVEARAGRDRDPQPEARAGRDRDPQPEARAGREGDSARAVRGSRVTTSVASVPRRSATSSEVPDSRSEVSVPRGPIQSAVSSPAGPIPTPILERPLIALDWHQTLSHPGIGVPGQVIDTLRFAQRKQFDLAIISFCSNLDTQRNVLQEARQLEASLVRGFTFIHTVNRKWREDPPARRPSLTGCTTCKSEEVTRVGAAAFIDDQAPILREVEAVQSHRARGNRTRCLRLLTRADPRVL